VKLVRNLVFLWIALSMARHCAAGPLSWESVGPPGGDRFMIKVSPGSTQTVFVLGYHAVHRSDDAGETWSMKQSPEMAPDTFLDIAFAVPNPQQLWVCGAQSGAWYSGDNGENWEQRSSGLPTTGNGEHFPVTSVAMTSGQGLFAGLGSSGADGYPLGIVYRSDDMGLSWVPDATGIALTTNGEKVVALVSVDASGELWSMVYGAGVYAYSNGMWMSRNGNLPAAAQKATFLVHDASNSARKILGTQDDWVYETVDGGATWNRLPLPTELAALSRLPLVYTSAIDPNNPEIVLVRAMDTDGSIEFPLFRPESGQDSGAGLYISADGGSNWLQRQLFVFRLAAEPSTTIEDVVPGFGLLERTKTWYRTAGGHQSVLRSNDGIVTFDVKTEGIDTVWINKTWEHPAPPAPFTNLVFAASEDGLFLMSNGFTAGWSYAKSAQRPLYTWSFAEDYANPNSVMYATGNPAWTAPEKRGLYRIDLDCFGNNCIPEDTQFLSDTGVWRVVTTPADPNRIYAACQEAGVIVSTDGGTNWTGLNAGIALPASVTDLALDIFGNPRFASFRTSNADPYAIPEQPWPPQYVEEGGVYAFNTNSLSWSLLAGMTNAAYSIQVVDNPSNSTVYAATARGLYRYTETSGWERLGTEILVNDVVVDAQRPDTIYAATRAGIFRTTDGGQQWHDFSDGLPVRIVYSIAQDASNGTLYAGTEGASVLRLLADTNPIPVIGPSVTNLNFALVPVTYSKDVELTVTNIGEADMIVSNLSITPAQYTLIGEPSLPATVTPGGWLEFTARFTPVNSARVAGNLTITGDAVNSPFVIPLNGQGYTETGTLSIEVEPNSAGWMLTSPWGGTTNRFGDLPGAPAPTGTYSVSWQNVPGWVLPTNQPATAYVPAGQIGQITGIYTPTTSTTTSSTSSTTSSSTTSSTTTSTISTTTSSSTSSSTTSSTTTSTTTTTTSNTSTSSTTTSTSSTTSSTTTTTSTTSTSSTSTSSTTISTSTSTTSTTTTSTSTVPLVLTGITLTTNETVKIYVNSASGELYRVWWKNDLLIPWATGQSETAIGEFWEDTNIFIPSKCYRLTSEQP